MPIFVRKEDITCYKTNLMETIRYCKNHNVILVNKSDEEIEDMFWENIRIITGSFQSADLTSIEKQFNPVFNAWFMVDPVSIEGGSHVINFFVRLGRDEVS